MSREAHVSYWAWRHFECEGFLCYFIADLLGKTDVQRKDICKSKVHRHKHIQGLAMRVQYLLFGAGIPTANVWEPEGCLGRRRRAAFSSRFPAALPRGVVALEYLVCQAVLLRLDTGRAIGASRIIVPSRLGIAWLSDSRLGRMADGVKLRWLAPSNRLNIRPIRIIEVRAAVRRCEAPLVELGGVLTSARDSAVAIAAVELDHEGSI